MFFKKNKDFLKEVFLYTITSFGGPQGHLGMMLKTFVNKRKDLTEEELIEYNTFCQLLPGASSTQLISIIGYKKGGVFLSIVTFLIWILPACILMTLFSFYITSHINKQPTINIFKYIQPMIIGFLLFTSLRAYKKSITNKITFIIMVFGFALLIFFFKIPWVLPTLIVAAGLSTNFSNKRFPKPTSEKPPIIRWTNIWLFVLLFTLAGFLSESARKENWENRKIFNVFENFYRFGSLVFGGGDVLLPMMLDQYVARPDNIKIIKKNPGIIKIDKSQLLTGYGIVKAIPGPVFSYASYMGGLALQEDGRKKQLLGCIVAGTAIFLPSILLVMFFFPIWQNIKKYVVFFRALEGINAVIVGVMLATTLFLINQLNITTFSTTSFFEIGIILSTFLLLNFTKTAAPIIVLISLLFGWVF